MSHLFSFLRLVSRPLCLVLGVYLFNFSIDSRDSQPDSIAEDLAINDIESVYEFILEGLVGLDNAVAESEERDQDDGGAFDNKKFYPSVLQSWISALWPVSPVLDHACHAPGNPAVIFIEVDGPPPRV
ncbi:MAG: hypothetical protein ACK5DD_17235 [Cyclobacteriaceae bacterium]|jgi:hypothetical protein